MEFIIKEEDASNTINSKESENSNKKENLTKLKKIIKKKEKVFHQQMNMN